MSAQSTNAGLRPARRDQLRQERVHDTYRLGQKPAEPAACTKCGVVYHAGRWQWLAKPAGAQALVCPACRRIEDHFPAGIVDLGGPFFASHKEELMNLVRHHEEKQKADHALARIMAVEDTAEGVRVTTTDIHLARDLGEALHRAYQGDMALNYSEGDNLLRVHWRR